MAIMEHVTQNGQGQRGRVAPPLPEYTFEDSGITIRFRKIGPATQQRLAEQIMREYPKPDPPVIATELGDEPNPADPAHLSALKDWEQLTNAKLSERMLHVAALESDVVIDDAARQEIARRKRSLAYAGTAWVDDEQLDADENERLFYILHVVCTATEDLQAFGRAVTARSVPTEEAVQRHLATFPGDLPGARPVQLPSDPALGDTLQPDA